MVVHVVHVVVVCFAVAAEDALAARIHIHDVSAAIMGTWRSAICFRLLSQCRSPGHRTSGLAANTQIYPGLISIYSTPLTLILSLIGISTTHQRQRLTTVGPTSFRLRLPLRTSMCENMRSGGTCDFSSVASPNVHDNLQCNRIYKHIDGRMK